MDHYSYPTGTTGGAIAVRDLVDKTKWMRRFRGTHVYPVVSLSDTFMKTRFGGRQRPNFLIKRWVSLGPDEKMLPAPNIAPQQPAAEKPAEAAAQTDLPTVEEPSLNEQMNDEIPSKGGRGKRGRKAPQPPSTLMPPV